MFDTLRQRIRHELIERPRGPSYRDGTPSYQPLARALEADAKATRDANYARQRAEENARSIYDGGLPQTATNAWEREYQSDIDRIVQDAIAKVADRYPSDRRDAAEVYIFESIDGCGRVIYTWQAKLVTIFKDGEDAYEESTGELPATDGIGFWTPCAFAAMQRDALEALERLTPDGWEEEDDEEAVS
jgi:hypothetical protein